MITIGLYEDIPELKGNEQIRINACRWGNAQDTFSIAVKVHELRSKGIKKIVLFLPRLPYFESVDEPEWYVFCKHINILKLNAIETYSFFCGDWSAQLLRVFQVKNNVFIKRIMESGDFTLSTSNSSFFEKNILFIVESFNTYYILGNCKQILKGQPRTINLVCKHFSSVRDQRFALEYFDRVFAPKLDKYYVEGIEQIPYGEEE